MQGGFSWSSLGNSISSGLNKFGGLVSNTVKTIGNSQAFQQAKNGLLQSGVIENAGNLAGQTLNSLVDIGRLKVESDLSKLRDKVASQYPHAPPITADQLAQYIAASNASKSKPSVPVVTEPTPMLPMVEDVPMTLPAYPVPPTPVIAPPSIEINQPPPIPVSPVKDVTVVEDKKSMKRRKRKRPATGWGALLNGITGHGVNYNSKRYCY
uniref:PVI n=1 Tax=Zoothera dauma adenovirus TaxID=3073259 RepID=A0AA51RH15_9ADEN|nr:pVI [Zoothera dauma adenovirus]